jgi:DNA repair exonuclease SbcCD ATPase subunit
MLDKVFGLVKRWAASSERDRLEDKIDHLEEKIDRFDERLDGIEKIQAEKNAKIAAIHEISLANNEALEQKLNASSVSVEMVRQIVDARINGFQDSIKYLQSLIEQVLRRDCNFP